MSYLNNDKLFEALGKRESGETVPSKQYTKVNPLGFTGKYQVGEALLHDLGYFNSHDGRYYTFDGVSATKPKNDWKGTWTGKSSVHSYEDLRNNKNNAQETIIREAFEHNRKIMERQLGKSLQEYANRTGFTVGGILTGAHLCGPYAAIEFLRSGSGNSDENGTHISNYMSEFSSY